jgi:capsular polysaccharide biosynthesis protein
MEASKGIEMARNKMSFGRRLQLRLAHCFAGRFRWTGFRLPAGDRPLAQAGAPFRRPGDVDEKKELPAGFDAQRDEAVFRIDDGYATNHGATVTASGHLLRELSREWNPPAEGHSRLQKPAWFPRVHRVAEAASITLEHTANYCHFLFEGLPRLRILEQCGVSHDVPVYANAKQVFQRELLPLFGVPKERLIDASEYPLLQAKRLWVPTYSGRQGKFSGEAIAYLRAVILKKLEADAPLRIGSRRLYISRRDATSRRILNEAEIEERLRALGFECLCLSDLPVLDQLRAFAEARVVVAAHGAALTNIVFSSAETAMVEIFSEDFYFECYQELAAKVGVDKSWLRTPSVSIGESRLATDLTITDPVYDRILEILHSKKRL